MIPSFTLGVPMVPTSAPFLIVPTNQNKSNKNQSTFAHYTPSFPVAVGHKSGNGHGHGHGPRVAHNNAHHLHSIPPAHKSTKSMILDHLLHQHAEARLAQISAELGLSAIDQDSQAGSTSSELLSEALRYGTHVPPTSLKLMGGREESRARASMARADGLEKVLGAMINNGSSTTSLPESVRFRIALGMLIDDIVAFRRIEYLISTSEQSLSSTIPPMLTSLSKPRRESNASAPATPSIFNSHSWAQPLGIVGSTLAREPSRSKELFNAGAGPSTSSPTSRCPRHLVQTCHRCNASTKHANTSRATSIGSGLATRRAFPERRGGTLESIPHFLQLSALVCTRLSQSQQRHKLESMADSVSFASTSSFSSTDSGTPHPASSAGDMRGASASEEDEQQPPSPGHKKRSLLPFRLSRGGNTDSTSPYMHRPAAGSRRSMEVDQVEEESVKPTREWYALLTGLLTRALLEGYLLHGWTGTQAAEILFGVGCANDEGKKKKKTAGKSSFFTWKGAERQQPLETAETRDDDATEADSSHMLPEDMPSLEEVNSVLFGSGAAFQEYMIEMEKRFVEFTTISPQTHDLAAHLNALACGYPLEPIQTAAHRFCESVSLWRKSPELDEYKNHSVAPSPRSIRASNDHTSSPSIQSHSPMLQQTPTGQRARLSPSISIASLVHPTSSPPLSSIHPSSSDSVSFLGLSTSSASGHSRSSSSVVPRPLDRFFATPGSSFVSEDSVGANSMLMGTKVKATGGRLGWAAFSLGAKRPREKEGEGLEVERTTKKPFLKGGMFNS